MLLRLFAATRTLQRFLGLTAVLWVLTVPCRADTGPFVYEFDEIAPGVWTAIRQDGPRYPVMGNATIVIGDDRVVVFDGGGVPVMTEQIIEHIRAITDAPVTDVVISHWHGDHSFGIYRFKEEYPGVQFVAHEFTSAALLGSPVDYIDRFPTFLENNVPRIRGNLEAGVNSQGKELNDQGRAAYERLLNDAGQIAVEYQRVRVTPATRTFEDRLVIEVGDRSIELLHLGHGNTAGDIVMWLPDEKLVATGDLVVRPTPYAFNVPPRAWAETLERLNDLGYETLVPGHGDVQTDTVFVDLIIETAISIAGQRDALIAQGMDGEAVEAQLDFSKFREKFTGGDSYVEAFYDLWFEGPFRKAAVKALSGKPMVEIGPRASQQEPEPKSGGRR